MTNPKQTSGQASTDARSITEQDINRRVAEALGLPHGVECNATNPPTNCFIWLIKDGKPDFTEPFDPLHNEAKLCRLLMDNLEGIINKLDRWHTDFQYTWWENPEFLANKELWILRALVAYKENRE